MKSTNTLELTLVTDNLKCPIEVDFSNINIISIDKSEIGENEKEKKEYNFIATARKYKYAKKLLVELANNGFFLVSHKNGVSIFKKFEDVDTFKDNINISEKLDTFDNLYYTIEPCKISSTKNRLLIVFSSVADFSYNASIARRNFFKNFPTISRYIPHNTHILRISDIGGIVGSFYLDNNYDKGVENSVQNLILFMAEKYDIDRNDIILYGVSKGGTGALYHGILGGYKVVSVDPIVSDRYHETVHSDAHFTQGIFPYPKEYKFRKLLSNSMMKNEVFIITSNYSPIYEDLLKFYNEINNNSIHLVVSSHPSIKSHPDVGPNTVNILMTIINNIYYNIFSVREKNIYKIDEFRS